MDGFRFISSFFYMALLKIKLIFEQIKKTTTENESRVFVVILILAT